MAVINQTRMMETGNHLSLQITHFSRGTFPEAAGQLGQLPVNRFFTVLENPDGPRCFLADDREHWQLRAGETYFIPACYPVRLKLSEQLTFISVQFQLQYLNSMDFFSCTRRMFRLDGTRWSARLHEAFDSPNMFAGAALLRSVTQDLISVIHTRLLPEEMAIFDRLAGYTHVWNYVQEKGSARTTVSELARLCGESRETFTRKFTAATGISPKQYLTRVLVSRASLLLFRNDMLIKEIASELGFGSEYYFSRFIKLRTGESPAQLRARLLRGG